MSKGPWDREKQELRYIQILSGSVVKGFEYIEEPPPPGIIPCEDFSNVSLYIRAVVQDIFKDASRGKCGSKEYRRYYRRKKRRETLEALGPMCRVCGLPGCFQIHHIRPRYNHHVNKDLTQTWDNKSNLEVLHKDCHAIYKLPIKEMMDRFQELGVTLN